MAPIVLGSSQQSSVAAGETLSLAVTVAAIPVPTYEWRRDGKALADDGRVVGARTRELKIARASPADAGHYTVQVSNRAGSTDSQGIDVTVRSPRD